jgi:pimeloyl-ACP methyl ester carboxylesterase
MAADHTSGAAYLEVDSVDGVRVAVWERGTGPELVLVHGSLADHTTLDPFLEVLGEDFTTFAMDRRGFGASEDGAGYSLDREFADVAAVVEAIAARTGGPVALFGHSYGAGCALGGAARTAAVHHVVIYEPGLGLSYPPGCIEAIEAALDVGDRDTAVTEVLVRALEMSVEDVEVMRSQPLWATRLAVAHTIPRECRAEQAWVYRPGQFASVAAPTLFLVGSDTTAKLRNATDQAISAIGDAHVHILDGHGHLAHKTDPAMVTRLVKEFCAT